jgi:hypothetical protein
MGTITGKTSCVSTTRSTRTGNSAIFDTLGGRNALASRLAAVALAMLLLPAFAIAQPAGALKDNPRLASLSIEIWPEYDRPAALVILKGALAEGVRRPAAVALRLPLASSGPSAVAFSATEDGNLLNLNHARATAGEFIVITFAAPERFFHIEFYEPIATTASARSYRYTWPGDLAAGRVRVVVQEPAQASAISVEPNLEIFTTGQEGLRYRATELGALEAGKLLPIVVRYTKLDVRPSAELMKPKAGDAPAGAGPTAPAVSGTRFRGGVRALRAGAWLTIGAALIFIWWVWSRRSPAAPARAARGAREATLPHGACTQCGTPRAAGDRFCRSCGTKLARLQ